MHKEGQARRSSDRFSYRDVIKFIGEILVIVSVAGSVILTTERRMTGLEQQMEGYRAQISDLKLQIASMDNRHVAAINAVSDQVGKLSDRLFDSVKRDGRRDK